MTRYALSELSVEWLKENGFRDDEVDNLQDILNRIEAHKGKKEDRIKLPDDVSERVATMVFLLDSITDADGHPICFEESGLITLPEEAKNYFIEDLELEELERVTTKLKKMKFARRYSDPRRRGTMKGNDKLARE